MEGRNGGVRTAFDGRSKYGATVTQLARRDDCSIEPLSKRGSATETTGAREATKYSSFRITVATVLHKVRIEG